MSNIQFNKVINNAFFPKHILKVTRKNFLARNDNYKLLSTELNPSYPPISTRANTSSYIESLKNEQIEKQRFDLQITNVADIDEEKELPYKISFPKEPENKPKIQILNINPHIYKNDDCTSLQFGLGISQKSYYKDESSFHKLSHSKIQNILIVNTKTEENKKNLWIMSNYVNSIRVKRNFLKQFVKTIRQRFIKKSSSSNLNKTLHFTHLKGTSMLLPVQIGINLARKSKKRLLLDQEPDDEYEQKEILAKVGISLYKKPKIKLKKHEKENNNKQDQRPDIQKDSQKTL